MSHRILIAEDEANYRTVLRLMLAELDVEILEAADGAEALQTIERTAVDLVITDVNMPHLSGLELLSQLRSRSTAPPVVVMTAYASVDDAAPKEDAAIAIVCDGPVGLVGGDGAGEVEMVVGSHCPGHRVERRTPIRDGFCAGGGKAKLEGLRGWSDKRFERDFGLVWRCELDHRCGGGSVYLVGAGGE